MQKKASVYIFVLIWTVVAIQMLVNLNLKQDDQIVEAFHVVKSVPVESDVEAYGYFGNMTLTDTQKEQMLINLAKQFGITEDYELTAFEGDGFSKTCLLKDGKFGKTDLQIISMDASQVEHYFFVQIRLYNDVEKVLYYRNLLEDTFANIGMTANTNIYLEGEIAGTLTMEQKDWLAKEFLNAMEAKEVTGNRGATLYTIYGYTENEKEYIYQEGEKVNVNLAITYDEKENKTYIHMAVPFISKSI